MRLTTCTRCPCCGKKTPAFRAPGSIPGGNGFRCRECGGAFLLNRANASIDLWAFAATGAAVFGMLFFHRLFLLLIVPIVLLSAILRDKYSPRYNKADRSSGGARRCIDPLMEDDIERWKENGAPLRQGEILMTAPDHDSLPCFEVL